MTRRVAAVAVLAGLLLAGCGGDPDSYREAPNRDPRQGWVRVADRLDYRCVGPDKIFLFSGYSDDYITAVKDSEDCNG